MDDIRNKGLLDDADLEKVIGGAIKPKTFEERRDEFELAWGLLKMEAKGFTGNYKAELFEEWEHSKDNQDNPSGFLLSFMKKV